MWFVPLRTFCRYGFGREMAEESGDVSDWQRQLHIYEVPLYYIDYCMAQTVAFQFWNLSRENYAEAWKRYMTFVDKAGTATFAELVESAGLKVPYHAGCIKEIGDSISEWLEQHELD